VGFFFKILKSYFGKGVGGGFKIYLYFLGLGDMGFGFWRTVFLDFFILFWWKGVGVVVRLHNQISIIIFYS